MPRFRSALNPRGLGFALAIVLAVTSVWLIVTGKSQKQLEIGVLTGLWGALLAGLCIFGRHPQLTTAGVSGGDGSDALSASAARASMPFSDGLAQLGGSSAGQLMPASGHEVDVRALFAVEREADAAARRDYEARLIGMLRHEVQTTMASELKRLSEDVAALRTELVEKVGGELRMERIETTRIFGSDIEALQNEVDQLKRSRMNAEREAIAVSRRGGPQRMVEQTRILDSEPLVWTPRGPSATAGLAVPVAPATTAVPARSMPTPAVPVRAAAVVAQSRPPEEAAETAPLAAIAPNGRRFPADRLAAEPVTLERVPPTTEPASSEPEAKSAATAGTATPHAAPGPATAAPDAVRPPTESVREAATVRLPPVPADVFAFLPRLSPFHDFDFDSDPSDEPAATSLLAISRNPHAGRRHADTLGERRTRPAGRHSGAGDTNDPATAGGRRRRDGDTSDNVLARLLEREKNS